MSEIHFNRVAPAFAARDFDGLVKWYEETLGFEARFKMNVYAVLYRDDVMLHIYPERDGKIGGHNSAYFFITGVDALYEAIKDRVNVVHPIGDQEYGLRDFLMHDPEGNNISFAEPQPH